ncbi:unnamed protein product [Taenia asiatica]|uniref:EF-hand domain-containing protein n=1 Tax=Taenia asiatica TaxID=60517 RepID=A0A0R3W1R5_TAEAS|nr:unnamed protein product [Taenia asiatica]
MPQNAGQLDNLVNGSVMDIQLRDIFHFGCCDSLLKARDKIIRSVLTLTVGQLLRKYTASDDAALFSDWINETFECCGSTQWHYEWWMDERGWTMPNLNTSYAWVPQSCCIRTAYYRNCGLAMPRIRPKALGKGKSDSDASEHVEEVEALFESGSFAATDWYGRLNNEPCPNVILDYDKFKIDVIIRCQLQRRRHFIRRLFVEADCQKKGNVTKAALLQIFHVLCPEMKMDQFHRLCERYCLNKTPIISFNEFEAIFGAPPFDEPHVALGLTFQNADLECRGYISIMHLLAIFRDIGLKVDLEEVKRYAKRQGLFVDSDKDLCAPNEKNIAYKQLLRQLECAPPPRATDKMYVTTPRYCALLDKNLNSKLLEIMPHHVYIIIHKISKHCFVLHAGKQTTHFIEELEKHNKDGGVPLAKFRDIVEATVGFTMHRCQWEDLVRRIRLKNDCKVDLNQFLSYFSKECKNPPYRASKAGDIVHDPELKSLVQFSGEPRGLSHLLLAIQKLIAEKFAIIDKIYKHFDHVGHATIDKHDFGVIMKKVGLEMCEVELDAVWRLVDEAEPSANGLHKYRQVMRFFLETGNIRYHLAAVKRNKRLHDPNLLKMGSFRQCQKDFRKQHFDDTLAIGKAASKIKYMEKQKAKPSEERVDELCKKIRTFVIAIWTDLRNGFLWQDPFGWGSMLCKDFRKVCEAFSFPLDSNELDEMAHGLDKHNNGHVNYVEFLSRFSEGHIPPKVGQKFDIVHHKLKNLKDGSEIGVREVMDRIRQICLCEYKTLLTGFRAIANPKHPEFFNEKDLGDFLRKHGMDFSSDCLYHLRTAYDQHRRGCINYTDFLQQTMDVTRPLE